jgi:chloramphenicol-sensitive protein RarD
VNTNSADQPSQRAGVVYGLAAYLWWGFIPLYFKAVASVPPLEVLAHRVLWSLVFLVTFLLIRGRGSKLAALLRDRRSVALLSVTTILIAVNWLVFIWAVFNHHLLQASLGYFINPLVNVLLGFVFLRERLRRWQVVAVVLALSGVVFLAVGSGVVPWVALVLAVTFGTYGLLRKIARPDGLMGLTIETLLLAPAALGWLWWSAGQGVLVFGQHGWTVSLVLLAAGPVTALPLVWFAEGARRLRYATIGFLQYVAPSLQFLLAVVFFGEAFTTVHAVSFGLIWTALAVYSVDTARVIQSRSR